MRARQLVVYAVIGVFVLSTAAVLVAAQTDGGGSPAGIEVAQARAPGAPGGGGDREARMAQAREAMRQRLVAAGATEADIQAIEAHRTKQREIMQPLGQAMGSLREAAAPEATDAQAKEAVAKYEAAKKTALTQFAQAEQDLKTKLNLATKAKLHAVLLSMGVLDNGMRGMGGMRGGRPGGERGRGAPRGGGDRPGGEGGRGA